MERLILKLLGRPEVSCGGQVLRFRSSKELALLFYLATEDGLHAREKLAALFCPESTEESCRAALRNALQGLRKALRTSTGKDHLRLGRDSAIGLDLATGVELDLLRATSNATRLPAEAVGGDIRSVLEELRAVAAAYRGEFLEGFSVAGAPDFDYWVGLEREGWRRCVEAVFARLWGLELGSGAR